ncbi:mitochondrial mRNA pseudouridine synthase TRUB2 isoform X3 [Lampris incognitus]|uniref:mitochondrial mRNA pseudouridine synthase TRUB2 isoform X3 n=1 Tax=Lampris incognitus TaxID=2546036 RepID=UPI0024B4D9FB|nr:mitochondrial mRNA pseudouridine synthase TRUB2 isoform X3 [Lampris incognitus]XP_056129748.1 mitochondrial mRNA pseudouridine synthase TRUB2 isoform X3 [Lampris incognitus]
MEDPLGSPCRPLLYLCWRAILSHIKVAVGHCLDTFSSGVLVLGVGSGNKEVDHLHKTAVSRDYTLEGEFGFATDDFSHIGRVIERTTYEHITQDKLERVLAMLQGVNQKTLLKYSNVDMRSQEAYEMAVSGSLGPDGKSAPILTGLRCIRFRPPHFTLEVQCINETQRYLRRVVHEIGLELRSTAVCKGVRRTRDGVFSLQDALTRHRWTAADITRAVRRYQDSKKHGQVSHTQIQGSTVEPTMENTNSSNQQNEISEGTAVSDNVAIPIYSENFSS